MKSPKTFIFSDLIITLLEEDITNHAADIIVNSANETLVGEDGVDGAIHLAAGPELQIECNKTGYCEVAGVVVTGAYKLPAKYIFHTVGPQWNENEEDTVRLLENTYYNNLIRGEEMQLQSIAFPSISTGQYGVPADIGARAYANALQRYTAQNPKYLKDIRMVTFYNPDFDEHADIYEQYDLHLSNLQKDLSQVSE